MRTSIRNSLRRHNVGTLGKVGFDGFTTSGQVIDVTYI